MLMYYGIFHPEEQGGFSVEFPDIEAGVTCGDDLDDAVEMAVDVLSLMLVCGHESQIHPPSSYEAIRTHAGPDDLVLPIMPRTPTEGDFRPRESVSVLLPECQLRAVDKVGAIIRQDRSAFITHALDEFFAAYYAGVTV